MLLRLLGWLVLPAVCVGAGTNYFVSLDGSHSSPFTNWVMAANDIQSVITLARDGDTITVSNGIYGIGATVTIQYALTLQSSDPSAPENTVLDGQGANLHVLIVSNAGAIARGFTVVNAGAPSGWYGALVVDGRLADSVITGCQHGVLVNGLNAVLSNCTVAASVNNGVVVGTSTNLLIVDSRMIHNGQAGLVFMANANATMQNCLVASNSVCGIRFWNSAVGINVTIRDSDIVGNTREGHGAGIEIIGSASEVLIDHCNILHNVGVGDNRWGGGIYVHFNPPPNLTIRNSLIAYNRASNRAAGIYFNVATFAIENCTIVSNVMDVLSGTAASSSGGMGYSAAAFGGITNTIVYYNSRSAGEELNWYLLGTDNVEFSHVCTRADELAGITVDNPVWAEPEFVSLDTGNFRLLPDSPCLNTGAYSPWMAGVFDLDRHSRVDRFYGVVDIGCYEYVPQGSLYTVR